MRSHMASGLSMKLVLSSLSMTTVRPSGTAPMGGTTKIVIWVTMIAETISAAAIAISLRILNSFSVAPACHSYLGKPVSSLQRLRIPRQPLTGCRLERLPLPDHCAADRRSKPASIPGQQHPAQHLEPIQLAILDLVWLVLLVVGQHQDRAVGSALEALDVQLSVECQDVYRIDLDISDAAVHKQKIPVTERAFHGVAIARDDCQAGVARGIDVSAEPGSADPQPVDYILVIVGPSDAEPH